MQWKTHVREVGHSRYIALPPDYCKAKGIRKEHVAIFSLNLDGSLSIKVREPVMNVD